MKCKEEDFYVENIVRVSPSSFKQRVLSVFCFQRTSSKEENARKGEINSVNLLKISDSKKY